MKGLLEKYLPGAQSVYDEGVCPKCNGSQSVYVARPVMLRGQIRGYIDEMVDCPECVQSSVCAMCGGFDVVRYDVTMNHPQFGQLHPCPACEGGRGIAGRITANSLMNARLPEAYLSTTFDTFDTLPSSGKRGKEAGRAAAWLWANRSDHRLFASEVDKLRGGEKDIERGGVVLQGDFGTGKTGLAAAALSLMVGRGEQVLFTRVRDLISSVQNTYKPDSKESSGDILDRYKLANVLVLDDMNLQNSTADRRDLIEELVRYRHGNALPTMITLNSDRDQFASEWGMRTATAVYEMAHWVVLAGSPLRNEGRALSVSR